MKRFVAGLLLCTPMAAIAAPDYKYCELAGLAFGAKKDFVGSIAARLVDKQGLNGTPACVAVWSDAFQKGQRLSMPGGTQSQLDVVTWMKLQTFETRVVDAVIKNLDLRDGS